MDTLAQDLRYALRTLRRKPGFTAVAVVMLALGIGANSAIFSVVDGVLLKSLPYTDADRLVRVLHTPPDDGFQLTYGAFSPQDYDDLERGSEVYGGLAAYYFIPGESTMNLVGGGVPQEASTAFVSADFFRTLGVSAALGRTLLPEEDIPGADRRVVLSDGFWRSHFGADRGIVGRTVSLDGEPFTIVGVMPPSFDFPASEAEVWTPLSLIGEDDIPHRRGLRWMNVVGRLAAGETPETAAAATGTVLQRLEESYPETNDGWGSATVLALQDALVGDVRPALLALLGAVALVLLIACANLANLLLARGTARARELAIRAALGAGRWRVVRQLLTESVTLALLGGTFGLLLAYWGVDALVALSAGTIPRPDAIQPDARVIGFTLLVSVLTGVLFGLIPAHRASKTDVHGVLKEGARGGTQAGRGHATRRVLVIAEIALAVVLLVGAGLMIRSFWSLTRVDPGFRTENVLALSMPTSSDRSLSGGITAYRREIIRRIENLPGVVAVGGSETMPMQGGGEPYTFSIPGRTDAASVRPRSGAHIVTPGYFRALGIPLVSGETFSDPSGDDPPLELILNRALARRYWPDGDPVGQTMRLGEYDFRIVGVAGNVRNDGIAQEPRPAVYVPSAFFGRSSQKLFVQTSSDPLRLADAVRGAIRDVNPDQPISGVTTMRQFLSTTVARPRFFTLLLGIFGGLALVLATLGIYGVLSYVVGQRKHDIGIRMALGARADDVVRLVLGETALLAAAGLVVGLLGAFALTRLLSGLLYGVTATDPMTFGGVALVLGAVGLLAGYIPARRAAALDPVTTLRDG